MNVTRRDPGGLGPTKALSGSPDAAFERLERIAARRSEARANSRSPRTIAGYRSDWRSFRRWAASLGVSVPSDPEMLSDPVPVTVVEAYILERTDPDGDSPLSPASISRHLAALRWWHHRAGFVSPIDDPGLVDTLAGIRRTDGRQPRKVRPIYLDELAASVAQMGDRPKDIRDQALLLVGWWGAFRRSELVGFNREDISTQPQGLVIRLRRSKTDQAGKGRDIPLHRFGDDTCPVTAVGRWLGLRNGDDTGPLFTRVDRWGNVLDTRMTAGTVAVIVKDAAERLGIDPTTVSGHSLRAGFVSECDRRGIPKVAVDAMPRHG